VDARATYEQGRKTHDAQVARLDSRSRAIGTLRLLLAAVALGLVCAIVWAHAGAWGGAGIAVAGVAFAACVVVHARVIEARERAAAGQRFHERGLGRLDHAWEKLPASSERFRSADHPFASDLDVFGRGSVMQLVDATETRFGEERLARLLSLESPGRWPDDVAARQAAVRELAGKGAFREALAMAGGVQADEKPDPAPLLAWAEGSESLEPLLRALGYVVPVAVLGSMILGPALGASDKLPWLVSAAAIAIGGWVGVRLTPLLSIAFEREQAVSRWRGMIAAIEGEGFDAPLLARLRGALVADGRKASEEIAALARVVGFVDARRNEVFRLLLGPLVMWDVHCAAALLRWRGRAGKHVRAWLDALGEMEALCSLAAFAFEHPSFAWPELSADAQLVARGLGHPLVADDKRVDNDVSLPAAGRALVVTGSNMSGKSTLLRALGVNAALGIAGAPVCARSAQLGPVRVATSMRIEDSLEQGVSHFYAELRRLKGVIDLARGEGAPVLFLLDEILHGTNSRERVLGACAVVRELVARGALGAVSTHDLGITALGEELGGSVQNVHFEEQVADGKMTFDYRLRPGIVQSSNALRLMRAVGIDVVDVP
jgi:hypothetical protein